LPPGSQAPAWEPAAFAKLQLGEIIWAILIRGMQKQAAPGKAWGKICLPTPGLGNEKWGILNLMHLRRANEPPKYY
jgi:hypothetical protein